MEIITNSTSEATRVQFMKLYSVLMPGEEVQSYDLLFNDNRITTQIVLRFIVLVCSEYMQKLLSDVFVDILKYPKQLEVSLRMTLFVTRVIFFGIKPNIFADFDNDQQQEKENSRRKNECKEQQKVDQVRNDPHNDLNEAQGRHPANVALRAAKNRQQYEKIFPRIARRDTLPVRLA